METNGKEKWFESRVTFMAFVVATTVSIVLFIIVPMNQMRINSAVIEEKISNYEENHFPTIDKRFDKLEEKIDKLLERG